MSDTDGNRRLHRRHPRPADHQGTIERIFEALLKLVQELDEEESRAIRGGLDEESLAIFDVYRHVFRAYPEVPSPCYERAEAA